MEHSVSSLEIKRRDKLNKKASEVNSRLMNMCSKLNVAYINNSSLVQQNHIKDSKCTGIGMEQ